MIYEKLVYCHNCNIQYYTFQPYNPLSKCMNCKSEDIEFYYVSQILKGEI